MMCNAKSTSSNILKFAFSTGWVSSFIAKLSGALEEQGTSHLTRSVVSRPAFGIENLPVKKRHHFWRQTSKGIAEQYKNCVKYSVFQTRTAILWASVMGPSGGCDLTVMCHLC